MNCTGKKSIINTNTEITFDKVTSQSHGGTLEEKFVLVKSNAELKKIFTQLNITRKPGIPLPLIDFDKESIIVLFLGQQNSGGHTIFIRIVQNIIALAFYNYSLKKQNLVVWALWLLHNRIVFIKFTNVLKKSVL